MTTDSQPEGNDPIAEQAAEWIVKLTVDDQVERAQAQEAYERWKAADKRHAQAAIYLEQLVQRMEAVRAEGTAYPARTALNAALKINPRRTRTRKAVKVVAFASLIALPLWMALKSYPPAYLMADMHTKTGEWQSQTLSDGTQITLNTQSAINLNFEKSHRSIELVRGEILLDVAKDAVRPFIVETAHGSIRALGTRFVVRSEKDAALLTMLESKVAVRPKQAVESEIIVAGQRVQITENGIGGIEKIDVRSVQDAWKFRQLVVQESPLAEVLDELDRHRAGRIQYDRAQIIDIKVTAVLPLNDTDKALQLLGNSFQNLRIRTLTPYLVMVDTLPDR